MQDSKRFITAEIIRQLASQTASATNTFDEETRKSAGVSDDYVEFTFTQRDLENFVSLLEGVVELKKSQSLA